MKKVYSLVLFLIFASLIVGCSNSSKESVQNEESSPKEAVQNETPVQNEQENIAKIENLDTPALVFFFTGVG
ncbi:hypothetical protein HHO41_13000 [Bacillus sp. DNRA2]|uniref:hypothetical protein n=1 Tax=Bacillus sp. DNRA2 TaxID=2723053 RepID=UPI00145E97E7|nr:hypothetical protein [Bacillus sp. DNRA2]NMD71218.1 hypothetical protein [Bacillus sp. DNRA2]